MTLSRNFFLLALAFCALCAAAGGFTVALSVASAARAGGTVAVVAGALAGLLLWQQAKRDLDAVLTLVGAFALIVAVSVGIYLFNAHEPGNAPKFAVAISSIVGLWCGGLTYRRQRSESSDFPDVLAARVSSSSIFETEGVQFTGLMAPGKERTPHLIAILLQNCFDAPRTISIRFDPAGYEKYLRLTLEHIVKLGAAEVAKITFPVVAPTYPGNYPLYLSIAVSGAGGKRVRLWRAQDATERTRASTTAALLVVGHLSVGGGIRFTIGPLPDDQWGSELSQPQQESLWQPRVGTVPLRESVR